MVVNILGDSFGWGSALGYDGSAGISHFVDFWEMVEAGRLGLSWC